MKNIFIILMLVGCVIRSSAQGSLLTTPGSNIKTANNAFIVLDNVHVVNNGIFVQAVGNGSTNFIGNTDANISGSSIITFDTLNIDKTTGSKVILLQNANVAGQVSFTSGLLDLNNSVLNLGTTGTIGGETEISRIFTFGNGYVQVINVLNMPVSANPGNLGAIISSNKNLGSVTVKRGHLAATNVSGSAPGIQRYYDIVPANDNGLKATLRFQYFDAELNGLDESTLELWKANKKNWTNVGFNSRSAVNNYVEKTGISTLSKWTLSGTLNSLLVNKIYTTPVKEKSEKINQLSVWPNPVLQFVNITINAAKASPISLQLYDTKGSLILMRQGKLTAGENNMSIDMRKLATGSYNLIAEWGAGFRKIKQVIKQ